MTSNINSEFLQVQRDTTALEDHRGDLSTSRAILPVYTIYDPCDVPIEHAHVASFINPISKGEDRRAHHEKTVGGCEGAKCAIPATEAAP
jgi:hypothetical protein